MCERSRLIIPKLVDTEGKKRREEKVNPLAQPLSNFFVVQLGPCVQLTYSDQPCAGGSTKGRSVNNRGARFFWTPSEWSC